VFLGRFILDLSANTCQTRHVTLRPRPLTMEVTVFVGDAGLRALSVCTKFEVRRLSCSEYIEHLLCEH